MSKKLTFPNQTLPELNLTNAEITPEYIRQAVAIWEAKPPDEDYKLILRAEVRKDGT